MRQPLGRGVAHWFARGVGVFTDGVWGTLRQMALVLSMRPDWDTAPSTFRGLAWYAGTVLTVLTLGFICQLDILTPATLVHEVTHAVHSFLAYSLQQAFYVCVFTAFGRWVMFWNCVARTASPLKFLALTYTVTSIDQVMLSLMQAALSGDRALHVLLAAKDVATMCLAVMVLVDFFRPRPPRSPRRKPQERGASGRDPSTRPAPI